MSLDATVSATFHDAGTTFDVDVALLVPEGDTLVVLGPSGSGKTLLLETIAGFHHNDGDIHLHDRDLTSLPPEDRDLGLVFQDYALFPHLTARENVAFGTPYCDDAPDPLDLLSTLNVRHLADRTPATLSGGEKQRVALARALAIDPAAFLLDEPLSSLDAPTRDALRDDLADILADETAVYVTHDQTIARALADHVAVMRNGSLLQTGSPDEVFDTPATPFVANFTGHNCLPLSQLPRLQDVLRIDADSRPDDPILAIHPRNVSIAPSGNGHLDATVTHITWEEASYRLRLSVDGVTLTSIHDAPIEPGTQVGVSFDREAVALI